MKFRHLATAFAVVASFAAAQGSACGTPFTTWNMTASNGQAGVMFDVENMSANPITICGMDVNLDVTAIPQTLGVWTVTAGTSHIPVATTAAAWTQQALGSTTSLGINTTGIGNTFTPIPSALSITIAPGQILGFAVGVSTSTFINYQSGTSAAQGVGAVMSNDGTLRWYAGYGKSYTAGVGPFGSNFGSATGARLASVRLGYVSGSGPVNWELNNAASSMDIDGVATQFASAVSASVRNQCVNVTSSVNLNSSNVGNPYEIVYGLAPLISGPGGALATTNGQLLNVDLTDPSVTFLFGLAMNVPFAPGSIPFSTPIPLGLSAQMANVDPGNPDGISLSAACRFESHALAAPTITYTGAQLSDDGFYTYNLGNTPAYPGCSPAMPNFSFYGTTHTQASVAMNGRVLMNGITTYAGDFSASVAEGLSQNPFMGCWTDLNPAAGAGASVVVDWSTGNLNVAYNNVVYFGTVAPQFSFSITLDSATGAITLGGINNLPAGTGSMFVGMTRGNTGATDPGATAFAVGNGTAAAPTDMLYAFGTNGTLAAGVSSLIFLPNMGGGYDWAGF